MRFEDFPLWLNLVLFLAGAATVWVAGSRLTRYVDRLSDILKIGKAFAGLLLLGGITSLPEVAASSTAAISGDAPLAVSNLLGGISLQVTILAFADFVTGRRALTAIVADPLVMLQASFSILLLVIIAAGLAVGDIAVRGFGAWTAGLFLAFLLVLWITSRNQGRHAWVPDVDDRTSSRDSGREASADRTSLAAIAAKTAVAAGIILVAGYFMTKTGEALAAQTGLGSSFFGLVFLALATSFPEVSTALAAARMRRYGMALGDIFGTNLFDKALIFLVDVLYSGPPVLNEVDGRFSIVACLLGIAVTTIYLAGIIERRDRTLLRMGFDSAMVLVTYGAGLAVLFLLR